MIELSSGEFLNGMPVQDEVDIRFGNGVSLSLNRETYLELAQAIKEKIGKDLAKVQKIEAKYWKRQEKLNTLINDITNLFYNVYDDVAVRKPDSEIELSNLDKILDSYSKLLGFE